jgi:transposase
MKRFIEGADRTQVSLLPDCVDDYVGTDNPVRVIEAFVEQLDLREMGFESVDPEATGRPAYHPSVLLKVYIYGYLNRVQSSRRLEQETQRNLELMWLTGRLMPDFKTIANFRKDKLKAIEAQLNASPDKQVSLTDPDARSMKNREGGIVGYNVQTAVDAEHHLIVAHEVINEGVDRDQLSTMAEKAKEAIGTDGLTVVADRGYFKSEGILECTQSGIKPIVPKTMTSNNLAEGRFDKQDFIYIAEDDEYRCPAGERAIKRCATLEHGLTLYKYWTSACPRCPMKTQCTTGDYRRITRWEHEVVLEAMQERLDRQPDSMRVRRRTAEHPFGTLKMWMGATHFLTRTLARVRTEMSLHVLAYNLKRVMQILGIGEMLRVLRA